MAHPWAFRSSYRYLVSTRKEDSKKSFQFNAAPGPDCYQPYCR